MPLRGSLMHHFSGILRPTLAENSPNGLALVENPYENLFLILKSASCGLVFHRIASSSHPGVIISSANFDVNNSIDLNSRGFRKDQSSQHNKMELPNYCWSDGMATRSCAPSSIEKLNSKTCVGHGFAALSSLYL